MGGLGRVYCVLGDPDPIGDLVHVAVSRVGCLAGLLGDGGGRRGLVGEVVGDRSQLLGTLVGLLGRLPAASSQRLGLLQDAWACSAPAGSAPAPAGPPTGPAPALSGRELQQDNNPVANDALRDGRFLERTPLWCYLLKEAEVRANGNSLGELGSRIVCKTLLGQLRHDPDNYLNHHDGWDPSKGVRLPNNNLIVSIKDFLRFATVLP
jgi:hypothetical protein